MPNLANELLSERDAASTWAAIGCTATVIGGNCAVYFDSDTAAYICGTGFVMMSLGFLKMYIENKIEARNLSSGQ